MYCSPRPAIVDSVADRPSWSRLATTFGRCDRPNSGFTAAALVCRAASPSASSSASSLSFRIARPENPVATTSAMNTRAPESPPRRRTSTMSPSIPHAARMGSTRPAYSAGHVMSNAGVTGSPTMGRVYG